MMVEKKAAILCVDDDPKNLMLLEAMLAPRGYDVWLADSGAKALDYVESEIPNLILLDIMMSPMSGFELLQKLRANDRTRMIPIVMLSVLGEPEDRITALELGCDDFISRPFDKTELLARIASLLRLNYYRLRLEEKEELAAIIGQISEGVIICGKDWRVESHNEVAGRYLGISDGEGQDLIQILTRNFAVAGGRERLSDLSVPHRMLDLVREETATAQALILEASIDVIRDMEGNTRKIAFTLRDATKKRREEAHQNEFLSLISHKLKTPLAIMTTTFESMKKGVFGKITDQQLEATAKVSENLDRLNNLFDQLIRFSTLSGSIKEKATAPIDLEEIIEKAWNHISKSYPGRRISRTNVLRGKAYKAFIAQVHLEAIFENLLDNAVKFNDKREAVIALSAEAVPKGFVTVTIADNGMGIPPEEMENLFQKFHQIEKYFTGQVKGAGLGLPLVKRLVEGIGGEISITSKLGVGTTAVVTLPAAF